MLYPTKKIYNMSFEQILESYIYELEKWKTVTTSLNLRIPFIVDYLDKYSFLSPSIYKFDINSIFEFYKTLNYNTKFIFIIFNNNNYKYQNLKVYINSKI